MFFHNYPYSDAHELNLDWIIRLIKKLEHEYDEFKALNTLTFRGDWSITSQYPKWSIVNNNGDGYVSLQIVPAGIPLDDARYWMMVANYTSLYSDLESRVSDLEYRVGDDSSGLTKDVDDLQTAVTSLTGTVGDASSGLVKDVNDLGDDVYYLKARDSERNVIFIGDSFMYGSTLPGENLVVALQNLLNPTHSYNYSYGGTGFLKTSDGLQNAFPDQLRDAASAISDNEAALVSDIIVAGGFNDSYANLESDYYNAALNIVNTRNNRFPRARIWFVPLLWNVDLITGNDLQKYDRIRLGCMSTGEPVLPGAYNMIMGLDSATYMQDATHPSLAGYEIMAKYIVSWMNGATNQTERVEVGNSLLTVNGEAVNFMYAERNGFTYCHLFLYTRNETYAANTGIVQLPDWVVCNTSAYIPVNKVVTVGSFTGDVYVDTDGYIKATGTVADINLAMSFIIPSGFVF